MKINKVTKRTNYITNVISNKENDNYRRVFTFLNLFFISICFFTSNSIFSQNIGATFLEELQEDLLIINSDKDDVQSGIKMYAQDVDMSSRNFWTIWNPGRTRQLNFNFKVNTYGDNHKTAGINIMSLNDRGDLTLPIGDLNLTSGDAIINGDAFISGNMRLDGEIKSRGNIDALEIYSDEIEADLITVTEIEATNFQINNGLYVGRISPIGSNPITVRAKMNLQSNYGSKTQAIEFHDFPTYNNDDAFGAIQYSTNTKDFQISANKYADTQNGRTDADLFIQRSNTNETKIGINNNNPNHTLDVNGNFQVTGTDGTPLILIDQANGTVELGGHLTLPNDEDIIHLGDDTLPANLTNYRMYVEEGVATESVKVTNTTSWSDFVFYDDYNLKPLEEVANFVEKNKHLPDVPSQKDIEDQGYYDQHEINKVLLQKIEELTLYVIDQQAQIKAQQSELENLKAKN